MAKYMSNQKVKQTKTQAENDPRISNGMIQDFGLLNVLVNESGSKSPFVQAAVE